MSQAALHTASLLSQHVLLPMKSQFVGKEEIIDLLGIALAGGENLFLHGPPGTAKSALVNQLASRLQTTSFDYLLTRFTEPSELFGPFDIRKLRDGDLVTNTEGMLPEAEFIFLDELLNANSAILNSLLLVLNERIFRRGRETRALPALMVVGASNHLPQDDTLKALFDRFLLRVHCGYVAESALESVLDAGWALEQTKNQPPQPIEGLTATTLKELQSALAQVDLQPSRQAFLHLILKLRSAGFDISDRRAVKLQRVIAASALMSGRLTARISDLWVLRYIWDKEEQRELLQSLVQATLSQEPAESTDHPQAHQQNAPDPEHLARDLASLEQEWSQLAPNLAKDRLAALASRIPWVKSAEARAVLQETADGLWRR